MSIRDETHSDLDEYGAPEWFVTLDAGDVDQATEEAFLTWLESSAEHRAAYERCEAAAAITAKLERDPDLTWAFTETRDLARRSDRDPPAAGWFDRPRVRFGMAALVLVGIGLVVQTYRATRVQEAVTLSSGQMADTLAPEQGLNPVVVVPREGVTPARDMEPAPVAKSIAVLPFQAVGRHPDVAYLANGIHDAILAQLAQMPTLSMIAGGSVLAYRDGPAPVTVIAEQLNVSTVLEGTVQYAGDRVRVAAQLIDRSSGARLWSEVYDRELFDVLSVQADVARSIAASLGNSLYPSPAAGNQALVWVGRDGTEEALSFDAARMTGLELSPDGSRIAISMRSDNDEDIWIFDSGRRTLTRLTFGSTRESVPVWTPDGQRIAFASDQAGGGIFWRYTDGTGPVERLLSVEGSPTPFAFSPDGSSLLYGANADIYRLSFGTEAAPSPLIVSPFDEGQASISPDGRWLAYQSNETGRPEIYVRPFPNPAAGRWQVSVDGGREPVWGRSGQELFYRSSRGLMKVDVEASTSFVAGIPVPLLSGDFAAEGDATYDVSPDGERFIVMRNASQGPP